MIIGLGNLYRGDDAAGLVAARKLREQVPRDVPVHELAARDGAALLEQWREAKRVILIDTVSSQLEPGSIHRFDVTDQALPSDLWQCSTHAFSTAGAIELARALNQMPRQLVVYGIEGKSFAHGQNLSPEVEQAMKTLVHRIAAEVRDWSW